ncbi:MAG: 50S ribosomal protein L4 [Fusobacteria bacterium]|nr:50S ribosomal protein L4 [Fusobacteriota bacterium]
MTTLNILNVLGEQVGTVETIFNIEPNKSVMHEVLTAELAAARQGSASTLKKGEVRGGGRKPFKQKGTGRARQGSIRAPHMRGGGVTFGPKPRDFDKKVNKKVRALAIKSALSAKVLNSEMLVLDNNLDSVKTKNMVNFMDKIDSKKVLFVVSDFMADSDWNLYLSSRNIKDAMIIDITEVSVYWLLKQEKVVLTKEALAKLEEVLA